jgi:glutamate--cysteine ligase
MIDPLLTGHVSELFPQRQAPSTMGVGVEQEFLTRDSADGSPVAIARVSSAIAGSTYERWTGFEPGGQVELSLPCFASLAELEQAWRRTIAAVRRDCAWAGVLLDASPVDTRSPDAVPLQLTGPRYLGMQLHLDRIGPAGRRMMRQTASTQVCLDWWQGRAGYEQWQLANLAGPFLTSLLRRSTGPGSRMSTWLAVDPGRTAYDDRLIHGLDPVAAYADFANRAAVFAMPGAPEPHEPTSFAAWRRAHQVEATGVAHHLSTLFPPVRPRGRYLEVRFLDAQPDELVLPVTALLARLLHDDDVRRQGLLLLAGAKTRLGEHWALAAEAPDRLADRGNALVDLARGWTTDAVDALVGVA